MTFGPGGRASGGGAATENGRSATHGSSGEQHLKAFREMRCSNRIALLDDDIGMLHALERGLRARGYETDGFGDATEFLDRANLNNAACLVLDVNLNSASGIEVAERLKASGCSAPFIFITASDSEVTRQAATRAGCVAYLKKPFALAALVDAIERSSQSRDGAGDS
jgi:FixJ family two-component response regulator